MEHSCAGRDAAAGDRGYSGERLQGSPSITACHSSFLCQFDDPSAKSGVALRLPPQSKKIRGFP